MCSTLRMRKVCHFQVAPCNLEVCCLSLPGGIRKPRHHFQTSPFSYTEGFVNGGVRKQMYYCIHTDQPSGHIQPTGHILHPDVEQHTLSSSHPLCYTKQIRISGENLRCSPTIRQNEAASLGIRCWGKESSSGSVWKTEQCICHLASPEPPKLAAYTWKTGCCFIINVAVRGNCRSNCRLG